MFIKQIPFFTIYRYYLKIYKTSTIGSNNPYTTIKAEHFKFLYNKFKNKLLFVKNRIAKYYNIKRMKRPSFKKESKV